MASISLTWDLNFSDKPAGAQSIRLGDDRIRETREAVEERASREMFWGGSDTNSHQGRLRAGAARAYYQDTEPTVAPDGDTLGSLDKGRILFKPTSGTANFWDGSQWVVTASSPITRISVQGTLSTGTDLVPPIVIPSAVTISKVVARVKTAPTGAALQFDINKNGLDSQSIFGSTNYVNIAATSNTGSQSDFDTNHSVLVAGDYLTLDIDQIGSSVPGADLSITILGSAGS